MDCTLPVAARRRPTAVINSLARAIALRRVRRRLADLDDRMLADIGLSRDEAEREARLPIWDVPQHWRG